MNNILKNPKTNAACISMFTVFYVISFFLASFGGFSKLIFNNGTADYRLPFWTTWSEFLAAGYHWYIVFILTAITIVIVFILLLRGGTYDEYHISVLLKLFVLAVVLTFIAIAVFFLMILWDSRGVVEKFAFFILLHWTFVVISDFIFVLIYRRK